MKSTTLKISVAGNEFFLACRRREKFCIGSALDCKLSLDGEGIAAEHCEIERISENTFVVRELDGSETSVNGVRSREMEIEAPFRLGVGKYSLEAALVDDSEAEGDEEIATDSIDEKTATQVISKKQEGEDIFVPCEEAFSHSGINYRVAIPALRFGGIFDEIAVPSLVGINGPVYSPVSIPSPAIEKPRRRQREPQPVGEASAKWFSLMISVLVAAAMIGYGWFTWRDYRFSRDPERLVEAVEAGDSTAMATLGLSKLRGERGSEFDFHEGIELVEKSAAKSNIFGFLALSELHDDGIHFSGAQRGANERALKGDRGDLIRRMEDVVDSRWWTMAAVAESKREGEFSEGGVKLLRKAARRDHPDAMMALARIAESPEEAAKWWGKAEQAARKLSSRGSLYAKRLRAKIHLHGEFPDRDLRLGEDLMNRAARAGDPVAMFEFALISESNSDRDVAFEWMKKASDLHHVGALANLARYRLDGIGVVVDVDEAIDLARKAIDRGSLDARIVLGRGLVKGLKLTAAEQAIRPAVEAESEEAVALLGSILFMQGRSGEAEPLLREAAESGNSKAALELGKLLSTRTEESDRDDAVTWLESAYASGEMSAVSELIKIMDRPDDPAANPVRAAELLEDLVEAGDMSAAVRLSGYYLDGRGVEQKPGRALLMLQKAAEAGETSAYFPLAELHESGLDELLSASPRVALSYYQKAHESDDPLVLKRFPILATAAGTVSEFLKGWESDSFQPSENFSATGLERYFHLQNPDPLQVAVIEAGFRELWSRREVSIRKVSSPLLVSLDRLTVDADFEFVLSGKGRSFSGSAVANFEFQLIGKTFGISNISESSIDWRFQPSRDRFEIGEGTRSIFPALPADAATYPLSKLPQKQTEYIKRFPFIDKLGMKYPMLPTSANEGIIAFSRIDKGGDLLIPKVFFDRDNLEKVERIIDGQAFGVFDSEYAGILKVPDQKDKKTSVLLSRAEAGDHEAEALVGECYYDGLEGFPVDRVEALKWFVKAARAKHPLGRVWIALMSATGEIQSNTAVREQFRDILPDLVPVIAESGAEAQYWRATAECYSGAEELDFDARQPKQLLERAIERGDQRGMLLLGKHLVAKNSSDGLRHLRFAADGRCASAAATLGRYYLGKGNDPRLAISLLEAAAAKNLAEAQVALGKCFALGQGIESDPDRAAFWLEVGLRNAQHQADKSTEVQARTAIRDLQKTIGDDAFRRASNFLDKKK